jgi:hypothetical protein
MMHAQHNIILTYYDARSAKQINTVAFSLKFMRSVMKQPFYLILALNVQLGRQASKIYSIYFWNSIVIQATVIWTLVSPEA